MMKKAKRLFFCIPDEIEFDGTDYYSNPISIMVKRYGILANEIICTAPIKKTDKPTSEKIEYNNIIYLNLPKFNSISSFFHISKIKKILRENILKCDACIIHVHTSFISTFAANIASDLKIPAINVVCGCAWDALWNFNWKGKLMAPIAYYALKSVQRHAQYSIYVTEQFLQKRYPTNGKYISCSNVELTPDEHFNINQRIKNIESVSKRKKIGTIAAVNVRYKGQQYIIKALAQLRANNIEMEYHIVGGGDDSYLRRVAQDYNVNDLIYFHGPLKHSDIPQFLDGIHIYAQPSKQEGLPRSVIEAMSRGCLCIGSNIAGIPELIDSKYLFEKGNVSEITQILSSIKTSDLINQSSINYAKSQNYEKQKLDDKRAAFLIDFKKHFFEYESNEILQDQ